MAHFPCLPQDDRNRRDQRCAELACARDEYGYRYDYPPGIAMARDVPAKDEFSFRYVAAAEALNLQLSANRVGIALSGLSGKMFPRLAREALSLVDGVIHPTKGLEYIVPPSPFRAGQRPTSIVDYQRLFSTIRKPPVAAAFNAERSQNGDVQNLVFAWQRVAGTNPMMLKGFGGEANTFKYTTSDDGGLETPWKLTQAQFAAVAGCDAGRLSDAITRQAIYVADYGALSSAAGAYDYHGTRRYLAAPVALFYQPPVASRRAPALRPIAIVLQDETGAAQTVTPKDGWRWVRARTWVQIADTNHHEAIQHLGRTHFVMEAVALAAPRHLAACHPLHILLQPHLEWTLALNDYAARNLLAPDGGVEQGLAASLANTLSVVKNDFEQSFALLDDAALPNDLDARQVSGVADYPYRDDGQPIWQALEAFVRDYLRLYYVEDHQVERDEELQAFIAEAFITKANASPPAGQPRTGKHTENKGRIRLARRCSDEVDTVDKLCAFVTTLLWTASAQHACLNFAQFPFMGFVPNMPGASYAPPSSDASDEAAWLAMLPPLDVAEKYFRVTYELSNVRENKLGEYPRGHFADPRVAPLVRTLQNRLAEIDQTIQSADFLRPIPYPFLRPSRLPASIHI